MNLYVLSCKKIFAASISSPPLLTRKGVFDLLESGECIMMIYNQAKNKQLILCLSFKLVKD